MNPSTPTKVLWSLLLCSTLQNVSLCADAPAPVSTKLVAPGVQISKYPAVRIGDIAPIFALPDSQGRLWNSTDLLGQWSTIVVLVDDLQVGAPAIIEASLKELGTVAPELQTQNVTVVVVTATAQFDVALKDARNIVLLREEKTTDDKPSLRRNFGVSASGITLVAIDKAGFLRRVEPLQDAQSLGASVKLMGDVTPRLEVGKAAPDFSIVDMNGQVRRLADLRGQKNLLLSFFPKCFTGG